MIVLADTAYALIRPVLFAIDAERAHRWTLAMIARMRALAPDPDPPELRTTVFGIAFANPVGLAAGMDKDARAAAAWNALGFGFAELGTITPQPQPGNPPPRVWRLPAHRALINRLGFPSDGMETVTPRLERIRSRGTAMRVAVNIGPNKATPPERVADDYAALMGRLGRLADFVVVNLSSPNTPGLREFQAPERMRAVVDAIRSVPFEAARRPPILIKLAPDLDGAMLGEICAAAIELKLDGIVATNTTLARGEVGVEAPYEGGLSGAPLTTRSREVIRAIHRSTRGQILIIGVGGIASAEDAYSHIRAGASLVELYTGLVYAGPGLVRRIKRGLTRLLIRDGFRSISEAVGSDAGK
jgi:dihydroorotate dehydrogenase